MYRQPYSQFVSGRSHLSPIHLYLLSQCWGQLPSVWHVQEATATLSLVLGYCSSCGDWNRGGPGGLWGVVGRRHKRPEWPSQRGVWGGRLGSMRPRTAANWHISTDVWCSVLIDGEQCEAGSQHAGLSYSPEGWPCQHTSNCTLVYGGRPTPPGPPRACIKRDTLLPGSRGAKSQSISILLFLNNLIFHIMAFSTLYTHQ